MSTYLSAYLVVDSKKANFGAFYAVYILWATQPIKHRVTRKPPKPRFPIMLSLGDPKSVKTYIDKTCGEESRTY